MLIKMLIKMLMKILNFKFFVKYILIKKCARNIFNCLLLNKMVGNIYVGRVRSEILGN
jgi:hypothetical protein